MSQEANRVSEYDAYITKKYKSLNPHNFKIYHDNVITNLTKNKDKFYSDVVGKVFLDEGGKVEVRYSSRMDMSDRYIKVSSTHADEEKYQELADDLMKIASLHFDRHMDDSINILKEDIKKSRILTFKGVK